MRRSPLQVRAVRFQTRLRRDAMTLVTFSVCAVIAIMALGPHASAARADAAQPGAFVWHDLITGDTAAARVFYGALFGWTFEDGVGIDPGYMIIRHRGQRIGGIVQRSNRGGEPNVAQWLTYVVVADVPEAAAAFQKSGGQVFRGPLTIRGDLRVAVVADVQGAPLGLASRGPLDLESDDVPGLHQWLWIEYVAKDADAALTFYRTALGFSHEMHETRQDFTYYLLATDRPRAGLFQSPWERESSAWLPYVRVDDPAAMASRVVELGGRIVLAPRADIRNGSLAIVLDPGGAPFALQRYPFRTDVTP